MPYDYRQGSEGCLMTRDLEEHGEMAAGRKMQGKFYPSSQEEHSLQPDFRLQLSRACDIQNRKALSMG